MTDAEGHFVIKNVPPGRYRIRAWHEGWQEKGGTRGGHPEYVPMQDIRDVKVKGNEEAEVIFDNLTPTFDVQSAN